MRLVPRQTNEKARIRLNQYRVPRSASRNGVFIGQRCLFCKIHGFVVMYCHENFCHKRPAPFIGAAKTDGYFGDGWTDYWSSIETDWKEKVSDDDIVLIPAT